MTRATDFLEGLPTPRGRTVETVLAATDAWLEDRHDWVQWAFPNQEPSMFNPDAPVWTPDEARALSPEAVANLRRLLARYRLFLARTAWWRAHFDHNHARITRVLHCLRDAGLHDDARDLHRFVRAAPEPGARSRAFWRSALVAHAAALREATADDLEDCLAVAESNVPEFVTRPELEGYRRFLERAGELGCRYVVAALDGRVVACGGLAREGAKATFCWGLVARGLHRQGLGTRLALERLAWAADDPDVREVTLDTSHRTRDFYARFGFEDVRVTPDGYAPGLHRHDMTLRLDDAARARVDALRDAFNAR